MPTARCNGIEIAYDEYGASADPALVMIMGLGCQRTIWAPEFCAMIAARGFRVVRFDNRDTGESTRLDRLGRPSVARAAISARLGLPYRPPYTLDDMARDTLGLLDALGVADAHLMGGSMGGMVAQHVALLAPGRVRSLCLWMTTPSHRPLPPPPPRVALQVLRPHPRDPSAVLAHRVARLRAISAGDYPFEEDLARRLVESSLAHEDDRGGFERQCAAVLTAQSRVADLARVRCPTLVMHGTRDPLIPIAHGEALARAIPGARFERLEGVGHGYPTPLWPRLADLIAGNARASRAARDASRAE